jgi:hypothetical protein
VPRPRLIVDHSVAMLQRKQNKAIDKLFVADVVDDDCDLEISQITEKIFLSGDTFTAETLRALGIESILSVNNWSTVFNERECQIIFILLTGSFGISVQNFAC